MIVHPSLVGDEQMPMPPIGTDPVSSANANQLKDTARQQLTALVGMVVENLGDSTSSDAIAAAIEDIADAINAKPSA